MAVSEREKEHAKHHHGYRLTPVAMSYEHILWFDAPYLIGTLPTAER